MTKTKHTNTFGQNKNIVRMALGTAGILLIPLIAMQFTNEVNWTLFDFIFAGTLLFGSGLAYELISRRFNNMAYKTAVGLAVLAGLMLIWVNGAVGIIGNEDNPANLMYMGVLAIGFLGSLIARFRPKEMTRTMFAAALAQAIVPVIAMIVRKPSMEETPGVVGVFFLNAFFVMLWAGSALLFRWASDTVPERN